MPRVLFFGVWDLHGISRSSVSRCTESVTKSICKTVENILVCFKIMFEKHDELFGMFSIIFKIQILDSLIQVTLMERENLSPSLTILKLMVMIILLCPLTINLLI